MGIAKATELFPEYMSRLSVSKQDDVADALLQALWYSQGGDEFIVKKRKVVGRRKK